MSDVITIRRCRRCHRQVKYSRTLCETHFSAIGHHGYVDAGPTRERIALLRSRGYSRKELSERSGISGKTLDCRRDRIQVTTERAIMSIPVPDSVIDANAWIPVIGTIRRIQALVAFGWPQSHIAEHAGLDNRQISRIVLGNHSRISTHYAVRIAATYDELQLVPGPCDRSRRRANKQGWPPPFSWDEDAIDNPDAKPCAGKHEPRTFSDTYREYQELQLNDAAIADRMGIDLESLKRRIQRHSQKAS